MFRNQIKNLNFYIILVGDMALFALAHASAYCIRFEFSIPDTSLEQMFFILPLIIPVKLLIFNAFGLYQGMWRYTSISDMWGLVKATVFSSLVILTAMLIIHRFSGFSRAVFILDGFLTLVFTGGMRLGIRLLYQKKIIQNGRNGGSLNIRSSEKKPVLIIGAGDAGEKTLREVMDNPRLPFRVVGFIDDDSSKKGLSIHGVSVLGDLGTLPVNIQRYKVEEVLIAAPSATGEQMRHIVETCELCHVRYRTLPGLGELIDGKVSVKALRDVNFQDLLGRPPVELNMDAIQAYIKDRCVLVTGAGGSIGSELCRQIVRFSPERLVLVDASEADLYRIQIELKQQVGYIRYTAILGAVQNGPLMNGVFKKYQPKVVFHAAAYKHVPMLEENPWQAVINNIAGSQEIMERSIEHKAEYFVLVSTDKAVRPTNVMGATKRVSEMMMQALAGNGTRMMAVRFGNVVGSSGSVIPLFREQIARGGPVTVTHPEITRFFMTVPEATQLILQAGAIGEGGDIFVLEMGTPVKIVDMARDLIRLSGREPDTDIEIVFTGLRPGEKLYEELITEGEGIVPTTHEKILVLKSDGRFNGHGGKDVFREWLLGELKTLYRAARKQDGCAIRSKLKEIVPEYSAQDSECVL